MSNSSVDTEILFLQSISNIFNGYVTLILIIIGTIGNLLNIFVFIRLKGFRRLPNSVFLIGSLTGSLVLLWSSRFPRSILNITGVDPLVGSIIYCKIRWLFGRWGTNMSFSCVCLASIDRYLNTSRNAQYRRLITVHRACIIVIIVSIAYLALCIPDGIYYSGYSCSASANARVIYQEFITYYNLVVTNCLSLIVLGTFSILTRYNLSLTRQIQRNHLQQQVNRMMLAEFAMTFITIFPNFLYNIYSEATKSVVKSPLRLAQETLWTNVSVVISFTMNVGTFFVYVIVSRAYRRNVRTVLCFKKQNHVAPERIQLQNAIGVHDFGNKTTRL